MLKINQRTDSIEISTEDGGAVIVLERPELASDYVPNRDFVGIYELRSGFGSAISREEAVAIRDFLDELIEEDDAKLVEQVTMAGIPVDSRFDFSDQSDEADIDEDSE